MSDLAHESHEISRELLNVRYKGTDPKPLEFRCRKWLASVEDEEFSIRSEFSGNRMLCSQLDLLDVAKDRVNSVLFHLERNAA